MSELSQIKDLLEKQKGVWESYKKTLDDSLELSGKETAEAKAKLEKMEADISAYQKRMDELEVQSNRPPESDPKDMAEKKHLYTKHYGAAAAAQVNDDYVNAHEAITAKYLRTGELEAEDKKWIRKSLLLSDQSAGGVLALPPMMVEGILRTITEMSPVRQFATVRTGNSESIELLKRTSGMTGEWISEAGTRAEDTPPQYGKHQIFAHECYVQPRASRQMLADSAVNLEAELAAEAAESLADLEATAFVSGSGVGRPWGITDANSGVTDQAYATAVDYDDLIDLEANIKEPYRANSRFLMHRLIVAVFRKLKDGNGQYLWQPSQQAGQPALLAGYPVSLADDLASTESSGNNIVIFGDLRRGYTVYDRQGITVLRDPYSQKNTGEVEFQYYKRTGGKVVQTEALRFLSMT